MLYLNANNINSSIPLRKWVDTIEEAMKISITDDYLMPPRPHYDYLGNTLLLMSAFIPEYFATKLVSVFPENASKSLPIVYGMVILNDGQSGKPLALLNGSKLTAMRTGAVGGLGVRHLSPKNAKNLGIIGVGVQGLHQAIFACNERQIERIYVYDSSTEQIEQFKTNLEDYHPHVLVESVTKVEELLDKSEIIITATASKTPVIPEYYLKFSDKTYIGVGSYKPDMQELSNKLFKSTDQIYVDTMHAKRETGDIINPINKALIKDNDILSIAEIITGNKKVDLNTPRIFKSVGMALFDLCASKQVYEAALQNNLGHKLEF